MTGTPMAAEAVLEVIDSLEAAGVRAGITGGWGIDALLRRETRTHDDVDLGIDATRLDVAVAALERLGYAIVNDQRPARVELAGLHGRVDLHPIVWGEDGAGRQQGLDGETFDYPARSLDSVGMIGGREVRCGTPELQLAFHSHYEPREHDRRDMAELSAAFGLPLPASYRTLTRRG
jgi:lincosamide nucleotidyltransferase A/C/D/E